MIYKKRSRVAHLQQWQALSTHLVFLFCAISGVLYLLAHEFNLTVLPVENQSILVVHGSFAYFFVLLFGAVLPAHIRAGWMSKRNVLLGSLMVATMSFLLISGLFLYYADETRKFALWAHWILGCSLLLLFPLHFLLGRRANYYALKHGEAHKKISN